MHIVCTHVLLTMFTTISISTSPILLSTYLNSETSTLRQQNTLSRLYIQRTQTTIIMQFTTLFTAFSLLASCRYATALPHGDQLPSPLMPAHRNTSMSRGYAGYEVPASMPYPKPTGTGTPHPPGCMCSHCRPHGNSTISHEHGNYTTSTTKVRISTMVNTSAFNSFPVISPTQSSKAKTVVHTTYVGSSAFTSVQPPVPAATATAPAVPHHPHARSEDQTLKEQ
jgi:hypothetical protein